MRPAPPTGEIRPLGPGDTCWLLESEGELFQVASGASCCLKRAAFESSFFKVDSKGATDQCACDLDTQAGAGRSTRPWEMAATKAWTVPRPCTYFFL
jgi:hypothetical protein